MKNRKKVNPLETKGAFITQPLSQADKRMEKSQTTPERTWFE